MIVYQYNIKRFFYVSLDYKFFSNYKFTKNQREAVNCIFLFISMLYEYQECLEAITN